MTDYKTISIPDLKQKLQNEDVQIIDIRDANSYAEDHIENALNISHEQLANFVESANKQTPVIVYCYRGNSSKTAAGFLASHGFADVYSLEGGFTAWSEA